jgi:hypothetical protein
VSANDDLFSKVRVFFMCAHAFSQVQRVELFYSMFKKQQALSLYPSSWPFSNLPCPIDYCISLFLLFFEKREYEASVTRSVLILSHCYIGSPPIHRKSILVSILPVVNMKIHA